VLRGEHLAAMLLLSRHAARVCAGPRATPIAPTQQRESDRRCETLERTALDALEQRALGVPLEQCRHHSHASAMQ